jgi:hypothetical protein
VPEGVFDMILAPVLEEGFVLDAGVDMILAPVLEEGFVLDAGVDMILAPVLEEEFERGDACAPTC